MFTLVLKLILGPLLIGAVTLAGRKWGPAVSGWLVGLPLTSAPVVLFLALDQGESFAATSAQAIMVGLVSVGLFCLTYGWLARVQGWVWLAAMLTGWLVVFLSVAVLNELPITKGTLLPEFAGVILMLLLVLKLMPVAQGIKIASVTPRWEIPARMVVVTIFILTLTGLAQVLGPELSGLLAPFPLYATILAVFTHQFQGAAASSNLLRGVVLGAFSAAAFCLAVAALLQPLGILLAFLCAVLLALTMHGISLALLQRSHRAANLATPTEIITPE